ncbi:hypothetical protein F5Y04DRAFT_292051 [Hypomontagnella monticulosa]|nr:hypothetical protein F5Y04DRAFT_292051 [Hypomontagnella monticulosa]
MSNHIEKNAGQLTPQSLFDYRCSQLTASSQRAADLYNAGAKLWKKADLEEIEQQLAQSYDNENFTIRCFDGNIIHIKNPMFKVENPIWKPSVKFQGYWQLVFDPNPNSFPQTYLCSYFVKWENLIARHCGGQIENPGSLFRTAQRLWNDSMACKLFKAEIRNLVGARIVTKIICFGLGEFTQKVVEAIEGLTRTPWPDLETKVMENRMIRHSVALTIAEEIRHATGSKARLLAQDTFYTVNTRDILLENGFEIVGEFGAGGFAEIDRESVVFSASASTPVKQIIADIAHPVLIIQDGDTTGHL